MVSIGIPLFLSINKIIAMTKYLALFTAVFFSIYTQAQHSKANLFIGTYTKTCDSKGVYLYEFDTHTGEVNIKTSTENVINPSFLTVSKDKKFLYTTNEDGDNSAVSTFQFDSNQNQFTFLNTQKSEGNDPCHIINDDQNVIVANYSGGNITVFGKNSDGSLGKYKQIMKHEVQTVNEAKPEPSHMHMLQLSPDKKYLIASDLGKDYLYVYRYNPEAKKAVLEFSYFVRVKHGAGPRHFTFSPDGKYVYLINELDGTLLVFKFLEGKLEFIQETTVVTKDFKGKTSAADIHISADGKFLYATNRGDANTISCFEIKKNGKLKWKQTISTLGKGPRNFSLDPTGNFLLVAHQYTNNVVIFKIDKTTGELTDSGKRIELCSPVCLVFE